nr:uracil-DNA glycosylase [Filibacter tadaridae]
MAVNCFECRHFYVTWDPQNPRGCRAHGFKTRELPSAVVKRSSGMDCLLVERKKGDGKR